MLSPYAAKNVTNMAELTGSFNTVIEGRSLIVLNEVKNAGTDRFANYDALKSIITERAIRIEEKCVARWDGENVANFIFCTNNSRPIKLTEDDRRYLVLNVVGVYRSNRKYWRALRNVMYDEDKPRPDFFDNLTSFFVQRDIKGFDRFDIPMTEAKLDLIDVFRSKVEDWINQHYDRLISGMYCKEVEDCAASLEMTKKYFISDLKVYCDGRRIRRGGKRLTYYYLREDSCSLFHQTHDDDEIIDEEEEEER